MGEGEFEGAIVGLSSNSAELRLHFELDLLTNLKFNLSVVSDELSLRDFYGKVVERLNSHPSTCNVRFTALPSEVDGYFQAALHLGAEMGGGSKK
jgi:hypothetical protein